jgi:hypothetical protein
MPANIHSLAPETRKTIFTLALTHSSPLSIKGIYPEYHGRGATTTLTRKHLAATQLNRLFRSEALPLFYGGNTFAVCLQPVCVSNPKVKIRGKVLKKRSYGDVGSAEWIRSLPEEAVGEIRLLRVYVACVTRWKDSSEGEKELRKMERAKCRGYGVADILGTKGMTTHLLFDKCSGRRLFYEVDLVQKEGGVEGFVETREGCEEGGEKYWGGTECTFCMSVLRRWVNGVKGVGGKKVVSREKLKELLW